MTRVMLDPTGERSVPHRDRLPRPATFDGQVIGLLDISKPRGDVFLDRLHQKSCDFDATRGLVVTIGALQRVDPSTGDDGLGA